MTIDAQVLPNINRSKLRTDLNFLGSYIKWCRTQNWRLVVYGGYGLDGYLQTITRNHGDIDIVIYGRTPHAQALSQIVSYLNHTITRVEIQPKDQDYFIDIKVKSNSISGNFYYVRTVENPLINLNMVVKLDGTVVTNSPTQFPPPVKGKLEELLVEVQDQQAHLADILRKRGSDKSLAKHDQDIVNLNKIILKQS